MEKTNPVGIFDSGMGGVSVLHAVHKLLPKEDLIFFGDSLHNPYGTKSKEEITARCLDICDDLIRQGAKAIVIACNTATSACVNLLRERYKDIDIIGMEPALKVAAENENNRNIAVWATDYTLKEKKFAALMNRFNKTRSIYKVPCPKLVRIVEEEKLDDFEVYNDALSEYIEKSGPQLPDAIVLGCTHFVFYKDKLKDMLPETVDIVDGNRGTARHLKDLLGKKDLLNDSGGSVIFQNSIEEKNGLAERLFARMEEIS